MATFEEVMANLDQLTPAERRRTLDHLNQTLDGGAGGGDGAGEDDDGADDDEGGAGDDGADGDGADGEGAGQDGHAPRRDRHDVMYRPPLRKIRIFSGKTPTPSGESDFETWHLQVRQILDDSDISEANKKITFLQSLLRPALDTISSISSRSTAKQCVEMLVTIYGKVEDGHDLLVAFHTTYQEEHESSSAYVNRLYLLLVHVAEKRGMLVVMIPTYLLRQFIRGCQDDSFVQNLGLRGKVDDPPTFGDFLLMIRKEESRRTEKRLRLRLRAKNDSPVKSGKPSSNLEAQVQQLTNRLAELEKPKFEPTPPPNQKTYEERKSEYKPKVKGNKKFFCFKCGQDFHRRATCTNDANPELVYQKLNC